MRRLKLLFITRDFSHYVERNTHYLSEELKKITDLTLWFQAGNIHEILGAIGFIPDFILLNDLKESRCPEITGLDSLNIPWGILMHDLHYQIKRRKQFIAANNVRHIFSVYRDAFLQHFPEYKERMLWLPHFVNTEVFKDYQLAKKIDWLMMGKLAYYYPLRQKIYQAMKDLPGFVYHEHPGYRNIEGNPEEIYVGEDYAREINRAKIFLTCDSSLHYPLIKYYEVLACNTLLLAPSSTELNDLGFAPGVHFVEINKANFLEKAYYYLEHEAERTKIAWEGCQMVHKRHSVTTRALELVRMINNILRAYK